MTSFLTKPCKRTIPFLCYYDQYCVSDRSEELTLSSIDSLSTEDIMGGAGDIMRKSKTVSKMFYFYLKLPEIKFLKRHSKRHSFSIYDQRLFIEASLKSKLKLKSDLCDDAVINFIPFTNITSANQVCFPMLEKLDQMNQSDIFNQFLTSSFTIHPNHSSVVFSDFIENFSRNYGYDWFNQNKQKFMPHQKLFDTESHTSKFFVSAINFYSYWEHQTKTNPNYDITTDEKLFEKTLGIK